MENLKRYIARLKTGEWADNLAVQGVADMLNINIKVLNTITPDWVHDIDPRYGRSDNTITLGLMGELHCVALETFTAPATQDPRCTSTPQAPATQDPQCTPAPQAAPPASESAEDLEDEVAFEETSKLRGIPYDTLLQEDCPVNGDDIYSVAPGEHQKPCAFLLDDTFEELANPDKYPQGSGGYTKKRNKSRTIRKYFNQRLLHVDGRFAKDTDDLLAAQYAVESQQVKDDMQISLRQTHGKLFRNKTINAGLMKCSDNMQAMIRSDNAFRFLKNVRGSQSYWSTVLLDLLAMVRQLGIPTWFLTLSAADMQWPEVIQSIARQYGQVLTNEDVKNLSWD